MVHLKAESRFDRGHMRHNLVHAIREKGAHNEMCFGRFEEAGGPGRFELPPGFVGKVQKPRFRRLIERQLRRPFQLDLMTRSVFNDPRFEDAARRLDGSDDAV